MLGSNMSALQGFAGSDATSTALSFTTGSAVRHPSLRVKQRRLFSDSVRRRRQFTLIYYREWMRLFETYSGSIIHGFGVWFKQGEIRRLPCFFPEVSWLD